MALKKEDIAEKYPLPAFNYKVIMGSETIAFSEVTGLNVGYEKVVYKHGLSFLLGANIIRGQRNGISIFMKRGIVAKRNNVYEWFSNNSVKDLFIDLCNEQGNAVIRWKVYSAQVMKMEGPTLDANGNDVAIESVEIVAHNLTIEYL